jgi:hypothetical protein
VIVCRRSQVRGKHGKCYEEVAIIGDKECTFGFRFQGTRPTIGKSGALVKPCGTSKEFPVSMLYRMGESHRYH